MKQKKLKILKVLIFGIKVFSNFDLLLIQHPCLQKYFNDLTHPEIKHIYQVANF